MKPAARFCSLILFLAIFLPSPGFASSVLYSNLATNNQMAAASEIRPTGFEIEAADDFTLTGAANITGVSFIGIVNLASVDLADLAVEFYRIFPQDSDTVRVPTVPTRANSPSDVEFADHQRAPGDTITATVLNPSFTALNTVVNGIHPSPGQTTGGEGPVTGSLVQFNMDFLSPVFLPAGHYFFVPQVPLLGAGDFYWISALRPAPAPFTPSPDLQGWIRNGQLDPDWLRIGTDIVGGANPPTFNFAFEIRGNAVPEPTSLVLLGTGLMALTRLRRS